ncbi:hypothetical protein [Halorhabdus salina]|uniref:hypothetical protein n=1 Tax=Halorhabdus salina TaxID=2750670 RepID=UPI0015EF057D|nr:hypothetical protein [Halorhabdus salina]
MTLDLTRRQVLAAGGMGAASIGAGAFTYVNILDGGSSFSTDAPPLGWIGDNMRWDSDTRDWQTLYAWDQSEYERITGSLSESARSWWDRGQLRLGGHGETISEAITIESLVRSDRGFATTGTVDVETLRSENFPDPWIRNMLKNQGHAIDVSVKHVQSHRGLDVYRQQFTDEPHVRAIAMNDSMCIVTNLHQQPQQAIDWATTLADNWIADREHPTELDDPFGRFVSLLDPGFVADLGYLDADVLLGGTVSIDGDTGTIREVMLAPDHISSGCEDVYRENLDAMIERLPEYDTDIEASLDVSDGAGILELTKPVDELEGGSKLPGAGGYLSEMGLYLTESC